MINEIEGDVFICDHGYYSAMVGKPDNAQLFAVLDVLRSGIDIYNGENPKELLKTSIYGNIDVGKYQAIVLDDIPGYLEDGILNANYEMQKRIFDSNRVFYPVTGSPHRPEYLYIK
jgi:hypothetical protein